jgi:hypothetical protein
LINEMVRANAVQGVSEGALGQQLVAGRNGIQTIFTFLDCQLPLPYTHLVCLLVKVWFFSFIDYCSASYSRRGSAPLARQSHWPPSRVMRTIGCGHGHAYPRPC